MINCDILIRENRRTLSISIGKMGEVIVKAPKRLSDKEINEYLLLKQDWINKHRNKIISNLKQYHSIINGEKILYLGELYEVKDVKNLKQSTFQNNTLYVKECDSKDKKLKNIKKWYMNLASNLLKNRLDYFSKLLNLQYAEFSLTNAKNKWGSCSTEKKIMLNWRLAMLNCALQDYVIVHELCHLLEMNHSQKFYKCIEAILPDYKIRRSNIKNYAFLLQLFR